MARVFQRVCGKSPRAFRNKALADKNPRESQ
jgi:hypothetical protein